MHDRLRRWDAKGVDVRLPEGWKPNGRYAVTRGNFIISKAIVMGATIYTLWNAGKHVKNYKSAGHAVRRAEAEGANGSC